MFWITNRRMEVIGVLWLIWVIGFNIYDEKWEVLSSWEFWVLWIILLLQIWSIIPEKIKSTWLYLYNKKFSGKYFNFELHYSFDFQVDKKEKKDIFLLLEEILKTEEKTFIISSWNFVFSDFLKIEYSYSQEDDKQMLCFELKNTNYTIDSLEKDLIYYSRIFSMIKDWLWRIENQSISSKININRFYTPEYMFKKYSKWYTNLEVAIDNAILLKRVNWEEELSIRTWNNLDDINDKLKKYIKLTL